MRRAGHRWRDCCKIWAYSASKCSRPPALVSRIAEREGPVGVKCRHGIWGWWATLCAWLGCHKASWLSSGGGEMTRAEQAGPGKSHVLTLHLLLYIKDSR